MAWAGAAAIEAAFKYAKTRPPVFRRRLSWFKTSRWFEIERAKKELGYQPRVPLSAGLRKTAAWYRKNGYLQRASLWLIGLGGSYWLTEAPVAMI